MSCCFGGDEPAFFGHLPAGLCIYAGCNGGVAFEYRSPQEQMERIYAHACGAGDGVHYFGGRYVFGDFEGCGMLDAISKDFVHILPDALLPYLHIAIGVLGIPLELVLSTDAYYFGLFRLWSRLPRRRAWRLTQQVMRC